MKFSLVTLAERLDFESRRRDNDYSFSARRGWTLTAAEGGIVASHPEVPEAEWIPGAAIARATVLDEAKGKGK